MPTVTDGRTLGHEAVGTVVATGDAVRNVMTATACSCRAFPLWRLRLLPALHVQPVPRRRRLVLGHIIDGTQAQYGRVPFADNGLYPVPDGLTDEHVLQVADIPRRASKSAC